MKFIFLGIICLALFTMPVRAMEAEQLIRYSFAYKIRPKHATDMVTFVKNIADHHLIIFDRKGCGELWNIENDPVFIEELLSLDIFSLENSFVYKDIDGHSLLIGMCKEENKLYVYNLSVPGHFGYKLAKLHIGHDFQLWQKSDGTLIMHNEEQKQFSEIYPRWQEAKRQKWPLDKAFLFESKPLADINHIKVRDEGKVVGSAKLQSRRVKNKLNNDIFDTESLSNNEKAQIHWDSFECYDDTKDIYWETEWFPSITCYHKTPYGSLYCGHDGFVTVWKQKSTK